MIIKKGFTLIELVVVLVIMGSLLLITMNISFHGMDSLQARYENESIQQFMYDSIAATQQSNIIQDKPYTSLTISFHPQEIIATTDGNSIIQRLVLKNTTLLMGGQDVTVQLQPYQLGCKLITGNPSTFALSYKGEKLSCFQLDLGTCKVIMGPCEK